MCLYPVRQTLYRTVQDVVSSLCVLPNRISVSLVDDVMLEQIKFPSAQVRLRFLNELISIIPHLYFDGIVFIVYVFGRAHFYFFFQSQNYDLWSSIFMFDV